MRLMLLCLTAVSLTVGGCATPAQFWVRDKQDAFESYKQTLDGSRALDPIRSKIALKDPRETTFEMLANTSKPTAIERTAILEYAKLRESHLARQKAIDAQYGNAIPYQRILDVGGQAAAALLADLYNSALTYGEFAKKRQEVSAMVDEAIDRFRSERVAEERARQEQASLERLSRSVVSQQRRQNLGTTCRSVGNTMYCH